MSHRIVKNTAYLSSAFVGQKILSFIYFTLIARVAGVIDTGAYVFALSFTTIFSVFVDFGLAPLIQREIARHQDKTEKIIGKVLAIKSVYALGTIIIALLASVWMGLSGEIRNMVHIALALMVFDSYNLTLWSAFRGHHKLQYEAFSVIASQTITLIIGLVGLLSGQSIEILIIALLCGSAFTSIFASILIIRKLKVIPLPKYDRIWDRKIISESIPFGFAGAFTRVFSSIDSVLLKQMVNQAAVGFYAVPNKIVFALQFIPSAFSASIYPAMSNLYKTDEKKMVDVFEKSVLFLMMISIPMAIGIFLLAPVIIHELYTSEFDRSIPAMYILVWGVIFGFVEFPLGSLLSAIGQQRKNTITRGTVMTLNIVLNIILIPLYSFYGAAIAAVTSYALLTCMGIYWVRKYVEVNWTSLLVSAAKIFLSAGVMGVIVKLLLPFVHFTLLILLGAVIFTFMVVWLRVIAISEMKQLFSVFRKART